MRGTETKNADGGLMGNMLQGCFVGLLAVTAIVFVAAVLMSKALLPESLQADIVTAALFAGAFAWGRITAMRQGRGVLTVGAACGGAFVLLIFVVTALNPQSELFSAWTMKRAIAVFAGGVCGGVLSANGKKHKKRK